MSDGPWCWLRGELAREWVGIEPVLELMAGGDRPRHHPSQSCLQWDVVWELYMVLPLVWGLARGVGCERDRYPGVLGSPDVPKRPKSNVLVVTSNKMYLKPIEMGNRDELEDVKWGESGGKGQKKVPHSHLIALWMTVQGNWANRMHPRNASTAWYMPSEVPETIRISWYMYA